MSAGRRLLAAAALIGAFGPAARAPAAEGGIEAVRSAAAVARRAVVAAPTLRHGATDARLVVPTLARSKPGGGHGVWLAGTQTSWSGDPQVLLVLGSAMHDGGEWLRVLLPIRPDGTSGWIPRDNVLLSRTYWWIEVDKGNRTVRVYGHGHVVKRFQAVIGKPATPTPDGLAAVYEVDRQPDPEAFLGTWALPLTILSNTLHSFGGGPGRIAIHGRSGESLADPLGSARSHGCIRLDNSSVNWLASTVRLGTPVRISG